MDTTYPTRLTITKLPGNTLVLKQLDGDDYFVSAPRVIVIGVSQLTNILKFLVMNDMFDHRILEGLIEEYKTDYGKAKNKENNSNTTIG
jgi:hypothetical protein